MHITVRMVFYISIIGFKYIITKESGLASEIVALLAKKNQCNVVKEEKSYTFFLPKLI